MIGLVAALMLAVAPPEAPLAEPPPAPGSTPAEKPPAAAPEKPRSDLVCWDETPTGTRFSHKVCANREQIDQRRRDDQDWKMRLRAIPPQGAN